MVIRLNLLLLILIMVMPDSSKAAQEDAAISQQRQTLLSKANSFYDRTAELISNLEKTKDWAATDPVLVERQVANLYTINGEVKYWITRINRDGLEGLSQKMDRLQILESMVQREKISLMMAMKRKGISTQETTSHIRAQDHTAIDYALRNPEPNVGSKRNNGSFGQREFPPAPPEVKPKGKSAIYFLIAAATATLFGTAISHASTDDPAMISSAYIPKVAGHGEPAQSVGSGEAMAAY